MPEFPNPEAAPRKEPIGEQASKYAAWAVSFFAPLGIRFNHASLASVISSVLVWWKKK